MEVVWVFGTRQKKRCQTPQQVGSSVGLRGYEDAPISENRIRREHGIAYRSSYSGKCSREEGSPDEDALNADPVGI
jgi:hypothetical protein